MPRRVLTAPQVSQQEAAQPSLRGADAAGLLSIVIPIFNEADLIHRLHAEVTEVLEQSGHPWEIVYVNDGSSDPSLQLLLECASGDPRVAVVDLSRNWGHQPALSAGLSIARGDAVVLMDGDMQDPPRVVLEMIAAWRAGGKVVVAERRSRIETGLRKMLFPLFYRLFGFLSDYPIPLNAGIFGLLDRQAVDAINQLAERNRYLPGMRSWIGFPTRVVYYDRDRRAAGEPKQSLSRLIAYALDAVFSFSYKPLRLSLFLGLGIAVLALFAALLFTILRLYEIGLFGMPVVPGYSSTIVAILFLGGVQLISVGVLGEYIGRIYDEVKRRPLYLIQRIHRDGDGGVT